MENFLEQGLFGKIRSLADLEALGERSNAAYNRIWNQVEIGFLTRRGEFVTREEASRITGIKDVHGEDLAENTEDGDDNRVAIVAVFRQRQDKGYDVLVCKREYPPAEGEWVIPGGHAEVGEKIEAAAHREMKEETKLDLGGLTFIKKMPNETGEKQVFVYGIVVPDDEKAKAGDDAEKVKWLPLDDLPKLGLDNDDLIREIAEKMELPRLPVQESEDEDFDVKDLADSGDGWVVGPAGHSMALVKHPETGFRLQLQYRSTVDNPLSPGTGHHVFSVELRHHLTVKDRQEIAATTMTAAIDRAIQWANSHPAFREVRDHWVEESVSKFSSITDEMMPALEEAVMKVFPDQGDWVIPHVIQYMDPSISVVAIENGQVVGFYILGKRGILEGIKEEELTPTEDLSAYQGKKGIEGVALGVIPEARGSGLGSKLKDYPQRLGADYIWGLQLHALGNLEHWLKRRRVVAKNDESVATLQDYAGPVREGLEDDIDAHELTTTPATEENLIELFRQSGLQFDKAEDYGPHYRQFIGTWEPRRQPGQVVAYWTKIIEDTMGLNPHDFGFGYDPETGRMSVLVRKAVIQ
jgi:8-oxo-dGTP diphosphatase